jgi:LacI family transcriptional regulator, galactose operon repressor
MRVTIRDVARACRVDVSTVSRSIAGVRGISEQTRQRVLEAARRLNYVPNRVARGLVTGRSLSLGLLISDIRNPFFADVTRGAEEAAFAAGYDLILGNADLEPERQMRYIRSLVEKRVDGLVMNSVTALSKTEIEVLLSYRVPIVLLIRPREASAFSTVSADNFEGGRMAGTYLHGLGHRHVAHLTGSSRHGNLWAREQGFRKAFQEAGGKGSRVVLRGDHSQQGAAGLARRLFGAHPEVTAVFAGNDAMAYGVLQAAAECGRRIPRDLSLIGFDNVDLSAIVHPPLTTIHQPKYEMGKAAVEILLRKIHEAQPVTEHRVLGVQLVERESCRAL